MLINFINNRRCFLLENCRKNSGLRAFSGKEIFIFMESLWRYGLQPLAGRNRLVRKAGAREKPASGITGTSPPSRMPAEIFNLKLMRCFSADLPERGAKVLVDIRRNQRFLRLIGSGKIPGKSVQVNAQ